MDVTEGLLRVDHGFGQPGQPSGLQRRRGSLCCRHLWTGRAAEDAPRSQLLSGGSCGAQGTGANWRLPTVWARAPGCEPERLEPSPLPPWHQGAARGTGQGREPGPDAAATATAGHTKALLSRSVHAVVRATVNTVTPGQLRGGGNNPSSCPAPANTPSHCSQSSNSLFLPG